MTGGIRLLAVLAFAAVSALVAFSSARDAAAIPVPFSPGGVICFENYTSVDYHADAGVRDSQECDGDPSPGAATDTRVKFCVGWNGDCTALDNPVTDSNFGGVRGFIPAAAVVKPSDQYPIGALAGALSSDAVLGVLGNGCGLPIGVQFTLMNASTNIDDQVYAKPIGQADVQKPLAEDLNGNGIPDGADKYPSFLRAGFDVDHNFGPDAVPDTSKDANGNPASSDDINGASPPLKPLARLFGAIRIYGAWVTLNFLIFEPGVTVRGPTLEPQQLNPNLGFPTAVVLNDPTVPAAPGAISDFCAPLRVRFVTFGLTHDNPCTGGLDTAATRGNCPEEGDSVIENAGYPLLPCENGNAVDEDQDGAVNDGCEQVNAVAESGGQCANNTSDDPEDAAINDGCPPNGETEGTYKGAGCSNTNEGGCEARKNSAQGGTIKVPIGVMSQRDADEDGIENLLDVCAMKANTEWNPRVIPFDAANDSDQDGLATACDPQPNDNCPKGKSPPCNSNSPSGCEKGIVGPDFDQDCYSNRADNCPTANQLKDPTKPASFTQGNPQPSDNVPQLLDQDADAIGDACDKTACEDAPGYPKADCDLFGVTVKGTAVDGKGSQDGQYSVVCVNFEVTVGAGADPRAGGPTFEDNPACQLAAGQQAPGDAGGGASTTNTTTTTGTGGGTGAGNTGGVGGPASGIGSLSPVGGSVPAWAAIIAGLGAAGMIASLGLLGSRFVRRRD